MQPTKQPLDRQASSLPNTKPGARQREAPAALDALLPQHRRLLELSAIAPEVAKARGYRTAASKAELKKCGFSDLQCNVPALLIPIHGVDGSNGLFQIRPDNPRAGRDGKLLKYETQAKARMALDVPPAARPWLSDPKRPLFITEGSRKADAAVSQGLCCIAVLGVWNFRGTNSEGGKTALPDWESVALNERQVYICYDSDVTTKPAVHGAMTRLAAFLGMRKAHVQVIKLPHGEGGAKVGLDDFFAAGGTVEKLLALAIHDQRELAVDIPGERVGVYRIEHNAIYWEKRTPDGPVSTELCKFVARIVREDVMDDGAEPYNAFAIEGVLPDGTPLPPVRIRSGQFSGLAWVMEAWGNRAFIHPGRGITEHVRAAIQLLSTPERRTVYSHLGGREVDGQWVFLHAGGAIGATGPQPGVTVEPSEGRLHDYLLPDPPAEDARRTAIRSTLALLELSRPDVMFTLLAAVFRAPLGSFLLVDLVVFIEGRSGSQKSELSAIAQAFFGSGFTSRTLPANWSHTENALEKQAFLAKDVLFTIDDFAVSGTAADMQRLHQKAERVLRAAGNHQGRGRMRADRSLGPQYYPRGMILTSGEELPAGQSLRARLFVIETHAGGVDLPRLTLAQAQAADGAFARTTAAYVQWLAARSSQIREELARKHRDLRDRAMKQLKGHPRTPDAVASLALGWDSFLQFVVESECLSESGAADLWQRAWDSLMAVAREQHGHQSSEDPVDRFIALLRSALERGSAHLCDAKHEGVPDNDDRPRLGWRQDGADWKPMGDKIGWADSLYLMLDPDSAFAAVQNLARAQGSTLAPSPRTLWKRLEERGLLVRSDGTRFAGYRRIGGADKRVLLLSKGVLSGEMGGLGGLGETIEP